MPFNRTQSSLDWWWNSFESNYPTHLKRVYKLIYGVKKSSSLLLQWLAPLRKSFAYVKLKGGSLWIWNWIFLVTRSQAVSWDSFSFRGLILDLGSHSPKITLIVFFKYLTKKIKKILHMESFCPRLSYNNVWVRKILQKIISYGEHSWSLHSLS